MRSAVNGIVVAGFAFVVAIAAQAALDPWLGGRIAYALVMASVAIAVWAAGMWAAIAVALAGYLSVEWLLPGSYGLAGPAFASGAIRAGVFTVSCSTIIVLAQSMRRVRRQSEGARLLVERELTQRAYAEAALAVSEERLAEELCAMSRLHAVSTRLLCAANLN